MGARNPVLSPFSLGKHARLALPSPPPFPAAQGWRYQQGQGGVGDLSDKLS